MMALALWLASWAALGVPTVCEILRDLAKPTHRLTSWPIPGMAMGDRVRVTACTDPKLEGMLATVLIVEGSTLYVSRSRIRSGLARFAKACAIKETTDR